MRIKDKVKLNKITHSVRASQAVLQYGVGAMVDFPEQTLMTAAPETWDNSVVEIHDERLERVLKVDYIGMPGSGDEGRYQNGVSYTRFPEWYFCPKCRRFKSLGGWINEYIESPKMKKTREVDPYMVKRLRCPACFQDLVVARIVMACGHGHIDDFPWVKWVHARNLSGAKKICDRPELKFMTSASSTEGLEGLTVLCTNCKCRTTLKGAFDKDALEKTDKMTGYQYDFSCTGRHPWKNTREICGEYPHVLQRGSSSVYFPVTVSSLVIPPYSSMLTGLVQNSVAFSDYRKAIKEGIKTISSLPGITITQEHKDAVVKEKMSEYVKKIALEIGKDEDQVRAILERKVKGDIDPNYTTNSIKYRAEEYAALSGEVVLDNKSGDFIREETSIIEYRIPFLKSISLIHKVREVQALVGFSRLEPVDNDNIREDGKISVVNIKDDETRWYPGYEVRGEGIFIEFEEDAIDKWRTENNAIKHRIDLLNDNYRKSYYGSLREREISSKFVLLHTISHLLIKQLSFECGYSIASLKERIYCSELVQGRSMAGIFIYTASGDSEGTMGGLVRQGRSDVFPEIFRKAIEAAMTCSNDPVCSLSQGQGRDSLNLSACYACTLVPETSCEEFNVFLDRGTVIGTFENPDMGFYSGLMRSRKNQYMFSSHNHQMDKDTNKAEEVQECFVTDYGMDLSGSTFSGIWKNIKQFAETNSEKTLIMDLISHADSFEGLEKPWGRATFTVGNNNNQVVDLLWTKARVMLFLSENENEYHIAKRSDWKCILTSDDKITWEGVQRIIRGQ